MPPLQPPLGLPSGLCRGKGQSRALKESLPSLGSHGLWGRAGKLPCSASLHSTQPERRPRSSGPQSPFLSPSFSFSEPIPSILDPLTHVVQQDATLTEASRTGDPEVITSSLPEQSWLHLSLV